MMKIRLTSFLLATIPLVAAAVGPLTAERAAYAAENDATRQADPLQFARGAQAWANNCARCHNMRDPNELRDDQWRASVAHMRIRGGLSGQEARDILVFLQGSN